MVSPGCESLTGARKSILPERLFGLLLSAAILLVASVFFVPTIRFGFIWDDPIWLMESLKPEPHEFILSAQTWQGYRYYRPIGLGMLRLFAKPDGSFDALSAHALQIGLHLLATSLVYRVARQLHTGIAAAALAAALFAFYPYNHQATARALQGEPLCTLLILLSVVLYLKSRVLETGQQGLWVFSMVAYAGALLTIEIAVPLMLLFPLLELWRWKRSRDARWSWGWLGHLALGLSFLVIWFAVPPHYSTVTPHLGFHPQTAILVLQAVAYPMGLVLAKFGVELPEAIWYAVFAMAILGAIFLLRRAGLERETTLCAGWFLLAASPIFLVDPEYARIGSRLMYPGSVGVALGWALVIDCIAVAMARGTFIKGGLYVGLLALCLHADWRLMRMYSIGNAHLRDMVRLLADSDGKVAFINFPDRLGPKSPPLPFGYWGVTLAEGALDLDDYEGVLVGLRTPTSSLAVPSSGAADRQSWPYAVDMRGDVMAPATLYEMLHGYSRAYRSEYLPDGTLELSVLGSVGSASSKETPLAIVGDRLELEAAQVHPVKDNVIRLTLAWRVTERLSAHDTIFVHVLDKMGVLVVGADGDGLGGLLPLDVWQVGDAVIDERVVVLPDHLAPGQYTLTTGVYNRITGQRMVVLDSQGQLFPMSAIIIGAVVLS